MVGLKEKSPGSKMLKKAKSFKDDLRDKISNIHIKRSNSNARLPQSPTKTGKPVKGKQLARTGSFSEGTRTEKPWKQSNVEKLQEESKKVFRALRYLQGAVDKNVIQMLPGSVTIVLETVMDVSSLINSYFVNHESSHLISSSNQVYQSLANLVRWADSFLVNTEEKLNKESANEVLKAVSDAVKELVQLSVDKLQNKNYMSLPKSPSTRNSTSSNPDSPHRTSLPDIPLTPREREILQQTTSLSPYDTTQRIKSPDGYLNNNTLLDTPPPKPPLPADRVPIATQYIKSSPSFDSLDGESPPPLPVKKRSSNTMEFRRSPPRGGGGSGTSTPLQIMHSPQSSLSETGSTSTMSPPQSPFSNSPSSSISSLNRSTDELLESSRSEENLFQQHRMLHAASFEGIMDRALSWAKSDDHLDNFNNLTMQIQQLTTGIDQPPPLPMKNRDRSSDYDNVEPRNSNTTNQFGMKTTHSTTSFSSYQQKAMYSKTTKYTVSQGSFSSTESASIGTMSSTESSTSLQKPPPLPPKKRHVEAYMGLFSSNYSQPSFPDFSRHSVHSVSYYQSQWFQHQMELFQPRSQTLSIMSDLSGRTSDFLSQFGNFGRISSADDFMGLPALPPKSKKKNGSSRVSHPVITYPPEPVFQNRRVSNVSRSSLDDSNNSSFDESTVSDDQSSEITPSETTTNGDKDTDSDFAELNPLDDIDVSDQLVRKKKGENGPDIRGGTVDALIVHATAAGKHDFMYQEAFLTTYRTFISPAELIGKLLYRYQKFANMSDTGKKRLSRNAFSLLVRVVDELCGTDISDKVLQILMDQVFQLLSDGELMLARILRKKVLEKCDSKRLHEATQPTYLTSHTLASKPPTLTDFKSQDVAEQMTLLDAELFQKIEIPEVLLWSKEQSEEMSPNLSTFTEHFNKMSYWCRSVILTQEDPKERERCLMKFIKIMKQLRKYNNFNSYLAILSAVDSAPIRRLEWQKQNMEALKEFCQLIDSSSSFRAYRRALSETEPPCIPYIGLILQDLTFVHIGNQDLLPEGSINFAKRWQQFNILDNMRRFKKCNYPFKKNPRMISYFNNFDEYLSEEAQWQISESLKPRGGKKKADDTSSTSTTS